jgi:FMN-dependent oxidoreductase (nitrilotriacetate monooxygenase family)
MSNKQMKLGLSLVSNGTHPAGWRLPQASSDCALDIDFWKETALTAEQAKIHFIFFADGAAVRSAARDNDSLEYVGRIEQFEPTTLIAALSAVTTQIGFIATASTTYNDPYTIARKFASLDYISKGRTGWNIVTSWSDAEAKNYNRDSHLGHEERYLRAEEFTEVVTGLWDSWEDDAFVRDKASGKYIDTQKMHVLNYKGAHFSVRGPLNIARPIQGWPVIAQAGSSAPGQKIGARFADLIYTAQNDKEAARAFYREIKEKVVQEGRSPESVNVMPGILPIIGKTEQEAQDKYQALQDLVHPKLGLAALATKFGDMSAYPLDGPIPEVFPETNGIKSATAILDRARAEGKTIRELYQSMIGGAGHREIIGTPESIADQMEDWFKDGVCDGFNIMGTYFPEGLTDFLTLVVPILQARGLFRTAYEGHTLRENLGVSRPAHPHSHQ